MFSRLDWNVDLTRDSIRIAIDTIVNELLEFSAPEATPSVDSIIRQGHKTRSSAFFVWTLNAGTATKSPSAPFATQRNVKPGFVIRAAESDTAPEASMLIAGPDCTDEGFISTDLNKWIAPPTVIPV
jgi:hypothetical protein